MPKKASERLKALRFKYDTAYREKLIAAEEKRLVKLVRHHTKRGDDAAVAAIEAAMDLPDEVLVPPKAAVIEVPPVQKRERTSWDGGRTPGATINGRTTTDFDHLRYFNPEAYAAMMRDVKHGLCPLCGAKYDENGYCKRDDVTYAPRKTGRLGEQFTTIEDQASGKAAATTTYQWECPDCDAKLMARDEVGLMDMVEAHRCVKEVRK